MDKNTVGISESDKKNDVAVTVGQLDLTYNKSTDLQKNIGRKDKNIFGGAKSDISVNGANSEKSQTVPSKGEKPDTSNDISNGGNATNKKKDAAAPIVETSESIYFHQYAYGENKGKLPPSLLIVQDKNDVTMALVGTTDNQGKKKLEFKELSEALHRDSGHTIELFSNKDLLSAALDNFKAGYNQTSLVFDKVYVALKRPHEQIKEWVEAMKEGEKAKIIFKNTDIPFSALEKIGIDRKYLDKSQIDKLLRGEQSGLIRTNLKSGDIELRDIPAFTVKLERKGTGIEARLTFQKDTLDIENDKIGKDLSKTDRLDILKNGKASPISLNNDIGRPERQQVVWNKSTNTLERMDSNNSPINIKALEVTYGIELSKAQAENLQAGKRILVENVINPKTNEVHNARLSLDKNTYVVLENVRDRVKEKSKELIER